MNWTTLEINHRVRTRKAHICDGCGRLWPAGTCMETWTGLNFGNNPIRVYICLVCYRFWHDHYRGDEIEFARDMPDCDVDCYIKTEAKLAPYVIQAGVVPIAAEHFGTGG